jgi:hypothetical protein
MELCAVSCVIMPPYSGAAVEQLGSSVVDLKFLPLLRWARCRTFKSKTTLESKSC